MDLPLDDRSFDTSGHSPGRPFLPHQRAFPPNSRSLYTNGYSPEQPLFPQQWTFPWTTVLSTPAGYCPRRPLFPQLLFPKQWTFPWTTVPSTPTGILLADRSFHTNGHSPEQPLSLHQSVRRRCASKAPGKQDAPDYKEKYTGRNKFTLTACRVD